MKTVNAVGLSCPEPIICVRKALKEDASGVIITVDDVCAVENISRYAANNGYALVQSQQNGYTELRLTKI